MITQTLDVDGHEFAPPRVWGEVFGPTAERLAEVCGPFIAAMGEDYILRPDQAADDAPMTAENVWTMRHTGAPGAFDMHRRLEAMDLMGVARQLIFPSFGLWGQILSCGPEAGGAMAHAMRGMLGGLSEAESRKLGFAGIDEHNEWAIRSSAIDPDRLRCVGMIKQPDSAEDMIAQARELTDRGLRGVLINTGLPPAGLSPAAPELDSFWSLMAERDVPVFAHVGSDLGFLGSAEWSKAPAFTPNKLNLELGFEPYSFATMHSSVEHFLTVMVMGGVFERHPRLRFGAIELGAHWLGPLAESLDMWAEKIFARRLVGALSLKPSEYLARNVRVTPHNIVEPLATFFERYPRVADCYCYSTDYPHLEGGAHIRDKVHEMLVPLGGAVLEQYFAGNGEWLLPSS